MRFLLLLPHSYAGLSKASQARGNIWPQAHPVAQLAEGLTPGGEILGSRRSIVLYEAPDGHWRRG